MEDPHITPHTKTVQKNRTPNRRMENETATKNTRSNNTHIPTSDELLP